MISQIFGIPGSGKTTLLAWVALWATHAKSRQHLSLCGEKICDYHPSIYTNFEFPGAYKLDYSTLGKCKYEDALLLIDEAMLLSDSRDYKNFSRELKEFYALHRHMNVDIILASQAYDDTDKKIRNLSANYFHVSPFFFGFFRVRHICPFFDIINYSPKSGYDWGRVQFINGHKVFSLFDSYSLTYVTPDLPPAPTEFWSTLFPAKPQPLFSRLFQKMGVQRPTTQKPPE